MNSKSGLFSKIITVSACILGLALIPSGDLQAQPPPGKGKQPQFTGVSFSGQATTVNLTDPRVFPTPILLGDTGPLPSSGGLLQSTVGQTDINDGTLTFDSAQATTTGSGSESLSDTVINNLHLALLGVDGVTITTIDATSVSSEAVATVATATGAVTVSGAVLVEGLLVDGQPITVTGLPNQVVTIPGGQLIINQQVSSASGNTGDINVTALQIVVAGGLNGSIGFAHADIASGVAQTTLGKLTGGGWITGTPTGTKASFSLEGAIRRGQPWGRLNYVDQTAGLKVQSKSIIGFVADATIANCWNITYNVTVGGVPGTATVIVCDNGEPGRTDTFDITLSTGYHAGGTLGGGNIQLHKVPPGWLK